MASIVQRAKQATSEVAVVAKRVGTRGKLELEARRIEARINGEKGKIGHDLYPLLADGRLTVDVPEVADHLAAIKEAEAELAQKRAEIEALHKDDEEDEGEAAEE